MSVQTNRVIEKAHRYVERRQFDRALEVYDRALEMDPEDVRILQKKGDLLVRMEAMAQAVQTYLGLAGLYSRLGFPVKAIAVYKQALKTEAAPVEIHLQLCKEYQKLKMKREEIESLEIVLAACERAHPPGEITALLQRLIELTPDSVEPTLRLCDWLLLQEQRSSAVDLLVETAQRLASEERFHEQRVVMERLSTLDPDYDMAESDWESRFGTLLDRVCAAPLPRDIPGTPILQDELRRAPAPPAQSPPPRETAFTEDEIEECLQDLDFLALENLFQDASDLLGALKARLPNNRRVLSCIQVMGQLLGSGLLHSHFPEKCQRSIHRLCPAQVPGYME